MVRADPLVRSSLRNKCNFSTKKNTPVNGALFLAEAAAPDRRTTTKKVKRGLRSGCFSLEDVTFPMETTFKPTSKPKTGAYAIGRIAHLMNSKMELLAACNVVAKELYAEWVERAWDTNLWPKQEKAVVKHLRNIYGDMISLRASAKLVNEKSERAPKNFKERADSFNKSMAGALDIQTTDIGRIQSLKTLHNPKATERRVKEETRRLKEEDRLIGAVRHENDVKRREEEKRQQEAEGLDNVEECHGGDADYEEDGPSSTHNASASDVKFPDFDVRTGRNTVDESIARAFVICISNCRVSAEDLRKIFCTFANVVCGQKWVLGSTFEKTEESTEGGLSIPSEGGEASEEVFSIPSEGGILAEAPALNLKKRKICFGPPRVNKDLSKVFPSRRTMSRWLRSAAILNLKHLATAIIQKEDGVVITCGFDDGNKSGGFKTFDVKAVGFHIKKKNEERRTLSAGYHANASHTPEDAAKQLDMVFTSLAILAGGTLQEIKGIIDMFMTDRAENKTLDKLGIDEDRRVNCCAHIILGADAAMEKVLLAFERQVGVGKLLQINNVRFNNAGRTQSIFSRSQIALAKLLSPSHATQSVALYREFCIFVTRKGITNPFKGYAFNRFGRICKSAQLFLEFKDVTKDFFREQVDASANLLVECCTAYIDNEWIDECAEIHTTVAGIFTFPYMELLGIDEKAGAAKNPDRNWPGVKTFLLKTLATFKGLRQEHLDKRTGVGNLWAEVIEEVAKTIERQMLTVPFFREDGGGQDLTGVPLTNLSCESFMAELDNDLKVSGGTTTVGTISSKHIVKTNGYLESDEFLNSSSKEKLEKWKWGKNSPEAKAVEQLYAEHESLVQEVMLAVVETRKKKKTQKAKRMLKVFQKCQDHGGPLTDENIQLLRNLNQEQLLLEIAHLRNTTACQIKQKKLVKNDAGPDRYEIFEDEVLRSSIKEAICPTNDVSVSLEELLLPFLEAPESHEYSGRRVLKLFNDGEEYGGTLRESFGPLQKRMHHVEVRAHPFFIWHFQHSHSHYRAAPPSAYCLLFQYDDGTQEDVYDEELVVILVKNVKVSAPSVKRRRSCRKVSE